MGRYRATLEYDGAAFAGWQRQHGQMSVQQALEEALATFARADIRCCAAGRTDAGVHARGQVIHFDLDGPLGANKIREAANGILAGRGQAIAMLDCEAAPPGFDARFSARKRCYRYRILNRRAPLALDKGRAWWVRAPLDVAAMAQAATRLLGRHDFTTFRAVQCQAKSPLRTLDRLDVHASDGGEIAVIAVSRSFLHNQVRSMVGSLKLVGEGKWSADDLAAALEARDRKACGPVAPPHGLYLDRVEY
jgi:tRNA pseudouridine38-40 synthase